MQETDGVINEYKKLDKDPILLKSEFHKFVDNNRDSYKSTSVIQTSSRVSNTDYVKWWLGFILDTFKDKVIIATCNHVLNDSSIHYNKVIKDIYVANKFVGSHDFEIDKILRAKKSDKDLAYIICKKPFRFVNKRAQVSNVLNPGLIWAFFKNKQNDYSFHTWFLGEHNKNLRYMENPSSNHFYSKNVNPFELDLHKQIYLKADMISKGGMSWGPVISEHWIEWIIIWSGWVGSTILPIASIVKQYEQHIKKLIT